MRPASRTKNFPGLPGLLVLAAAGALMLAAQPRPASAQLQSYQGGTAPAPAAGDAQNQVIPRQRQPLPPMQTKPGAGNALQIPSLPQPAQPGATTSTTDAALSREASDYLHHHRLPFVQAQVTRNASGAADSAVLSGQVATDFGKRDAAKKVRDFLGVSQLAVRNEIDVNPAVQSGQIASNQIHSIPQAFFGCWRGTSRPSDSARYLGGCPQAYEIPETQELCFRRVGDGGFEIAFQSASSELPNFRDHTDLISSQGDSRVDLSDVGSYDMPGLLSSDSVAFSGSSRCDLSTDKESLACRGSTLFRCDGVPWYQTTGHLVMRRVAP